MLKSLSSVLHRLVDNPILSDLINGKNESRDNTTIGRYLINNVLHARLVRVQVY